MDKEMKLDDVEEVMLDFELDTKTNLGKSKFNNFDFEVKLRPFMGVMGMPPNEEGRYSTVVPRYCGGNIDCKELVAGSTLYLPIPVDGALFSVGDGHAL
ncbi:acetamidase/formamidase family protein [Bacillus salitolerans]|uniref:Acetamidase/formamidase family protein n=1 Tax=Bacillus salitolerans TaxID=1437434 RepID=A0ABW4LSW9_9BACI